MHFRPSLSSVALAFSVGWFAVSSAAAQTAVPAPEYCVGLLSKVAILTAQGGSSSFVEDLQPLTTDELRALPSCLYDPADASAQGGLQTPFQTAATLFAVPIRPALGAIDGNILGGSLQLGPGSGLNAPTASGAGGPMEPPPPPPIK